MVIFHLFVQKPPPPRGGISIKFCTTVEVVDVITCDRDVDLWGSKMEVPIH